MTRCPLSILEGRDITAQTMYNYAQHKTGPLSSSHSRIGVGFITSPNLENLSWPDLYTIVAGRGIDTELSSVCSGSGMRNGTVDAYYGDYVAYWDFYARHVTQAGFHPVTCKMGKPSDPTAFVGSRLRVLGIRGLRVIDASIMPAIASGNLFASTVMIGEIGSDFAKPGTHSPVDLKRSINPSSSNLNWDYIDLIA